MNRITRLKLFSAVALGGGCLFLAKRYGTNDLLKISPRMEAANTENVAGQHGLAAAAMRVQEPGGPRDAGRRGAGPDMTGMELEMVQVFFRHGARTPLRHLPIVEEVNYDPRFLLYKLSYTDIPYVVKSLDGGPRPQSVMDNRYKKVVFRTGAVAGMLTALGQDQVFCLGRQLRKDYPKIFGETYDPHRVWIQSTNINRCIESLKCVLAGAYGEASFREKDPVVIPVSSFKEETLHPNLRSCPTLKAMSNRVREKQAEIPDLQEISEKLNKLLGLEGRVDLMTWRDHIAARKAHGLPLPQFMLDLEEEIEKGAITMLQSYMSGLPEDQPHSMKLTVGRTFYNIVNKMEQVANNESEYRLCLFSCHDSTLAPLLNGLGAFDGRWPPYAADLRFELWRDQQGQHWVLTKYLDEHLNVGGLDKKMLTLTEFKEILEPYAINRKDYMALCSMSQAFWDALDDSDNGDTPVPENM